MKEKADAKREMEKRWMHLEEEKFWFEKAERAFAVGSGAAAEETELVCAMMQKRIIASLQNLSEKRDDNCTLVATDSVTTKNSEEVEVVRTSFETPSDIARLESQIVVFVLLPEQPRLPIPPPLPPPGSQDMGLQPPPGYCESSDDVLRLCGLH